MEHFSSGNSDRRVSDENAPFGRRGPSHRDICLMPHPNIIVFHARSYSHAF